MRSDLILLGLSAATAGLGLCQTQPARLEFEVASVKPAAPLSTEGGSFGRHIDGAQVRFVQTSLRDYIRIAYRMRDYQIEGPEWLASARFDVSGKVPEGCTQDQVPEMLQALLADRLGLKLHRASRNLPVYALVVRSDGLKMKESPPDPADSLSAKKPVQVTVSGGHGRGGAIDYGEGSYFALPHYRLEGRKLAMASFADALAHLTDRPVIDQTGLSARYDFAVDLTEDDYDAMMTRATMSIGLAQSPKDMLQLATVGDPLPTALRGLGLKLESRKGPVEVLVVDDNRTAPTEN